MNDDEIIEEWDNDEDELFNADPDCDHEVINLWSGVKCRKCGGWYCL